MSLPAILRPNGRLYHPRKVVARLLDNDRGESDSLVLVTGTHDVERGLPLAAELVAGTLGSHCGPWFIRQGWFRETIRNHEPYWDDDEVRGAAGVIFEVRDGA